MTPAPYDAIILGAGAAGMMAAATAGARGKRVLLLDHAAEPGKKILISGGGRCNFTNIGTAPDRFLSSNPHFARSALGRYTPADFVALVEKHGIAYHEKTLGQLFCDGSARQVVALLVDECDAAHVDTRLGHRITGVDHDGGGFRVATDHGDFTAPALVLATGGPAIPQIGATGFAYDVARKFGLKIVEPRPGLVPLTFSTGLLDLCRGLSGVAVDAVTSIGKTVFREALLFTHRGLSGPAILQISSYWHGSPVTLDLAPGVDVAAWLRDRRRTRPRAEGATLLGELLPARLASALSTRLGLGGTLANLNDRVLDAAAAGVSAFTVTPTGTEGFAKAEVAAGGIDTAGLSSKTMAATAVPGLYAIGEAVDVTGWLGGYNFQWAWASGVAAGGAI
ncbi:MAG: NAD(P)/FAD-dependent oxidoreductase [Janthinobacterium lividum]